MLLLATMTLDVGNLMQLLTFLIVMAVHWGITKTKINSLEGAVAKLQELKAGELGVKIAEHEKRLEVVEAEQGQLRLTIYDMKAKVEASGIKVDLIYDLLKDEREGK